MKTRNFKSMALVLIFTFSFTLINAKTLNENYQSFNLEKIEQKVVDGISVKTYELAYLDANEKVEIDAFKKNNKRYFIVRGVDFEVQYECNENHAFGAKYVDKKYATFPKKDMKSKLNTEQLMYQKVITKTPKTDENLMALIASYYPLLVN